MNLRRNFLILASSAVLAFAQGGGPRGGHMGPGRGPADSQEGIQRHVDRLASWLSLTDAQKTAATKIFTDAMTASANLRTSMENLHDSLRQAVQSNNTSGIDSTSAQIGTTSGQLTAIHAKAEAAFYALLTADQKTKYNERPERGRGPGMGPGASGGMRPNSSGRR